MNNQSGPSPFLLLGDHAGNLVPSTLGTLGLSEEELRSHIAWDIGVRSLGELLSKRLDAVFISQRYSRLVIDCNRDPSAASAVTSLSDGIAISGNAILSPHDRSHRIAAVFHPYHESITAELKRRSVAGRAAIIVALHSFTPSLKTEGTDRPWEIGVLYDRGNTSFAVDLLDVLRCVDNLTVGDNEPYSMTAGNDYTVPKHAYRQMLPYVELEIRQDLLKSRREIEMWTGILGEALLAAIER